MRKKNWNGPILQQYFGHIGYFLMEGLYLFLGGQKTICFQILSKLVDKQNFWQILRSPHLPWKPLFQNFDFRFGFRKPKKLSGTKFYWNRLAKKNWAVLVAPPPRSGAPFSEFQNSDFIFSFRKAKSYVVPNFIEIGWQNFFCQILRFLPPGGPLFKILKFWLQIWF